MDGGIEIRYCLRGYRLKQCYCHSNLMGVGDTSTTQCLKNQKNRRLFISK